MADITISLTISAGIENVVSNGSSYFVRTATNSY
jgi:hypothetical protein